MGKRGLIRSTATAATSNAKAAIPANHTQRGRCPFRCVAGNTMRECSLLPGYFRSEVLKDRMSPFAHCNRILISLTPTAPSLGRCRYTLYSTSPCRTAVERLMASAVIFVGGKQLIRSLGSSKRRTTKPLLQTSSGSARTHSCTPESRNSRPCLHILTVGIQARRFLQFPCRTQDQ